MEGTLVTGEGVGAAFVSATADTLADAVGFYPFPGTVNLDGVDDTGELPTRRLEDDLGDPHCDGVILRPCTIGGVRASVVRPLVPDYPPSKLELLAPVHLRALFGLDEGASLSLGPPDRLWWPSGPRATYDSLDTFDAVVFDLDNTLVELAVEWPAVHEEIEASFGSRLEKPVTEHEEDELFEVAERGAFREELAGLLERRELAGAASATALSGVHELSALDVPVGICTANAVRAAETALESFGAREDVDAIVGRESTTAGKPHPAPLLECLDRLGVDPGSAVFVGDQATDAEAAQRAGTSFLHPDQLVSTTAAQSST